MVVVDARAKALIETPSRVADSYLTPPVRECFMLMGRVSSIKIQTLLKTFSRYY